MSQIPWSINKVKSLHTVTAADGSSIDNVPDNGSLLVSEAEFFAEVRDAINEKTFNQIEFVNKVVCFFMRSRFGLPETITDKEILGFGTDQEMTVQLRQALYDFFLYGPDGKPEKSGDVGAGSEKKEPTGESDFGNSSLPTQDTPISAPTTTEDVPPPLSVLPSTITKNIA